MERSIKINDSTLKKIKTCARKEKRSMKAVLEIAAINYLQKKILER